MLLNTRKRKTRVKFNPGLSANRPSNNWANGQRYDPVYTGPHKFLNGQKIAWIRLSFTVNACPFKNLPEPV